MLQLADLATITEAIKGNLVVYVGVAAALAGYVATVSTELQKILGPLGRWLAARQARRVHRAAAQTDVRILDMQGQLDHVVPRLDGVERQLYEMRRLVLQHEPWDWQALSDLRRTDPAYPEPPPMLPPPTPKTEGA